MIRRRFVRLPDNRHVHYRRAGEGPPLILLHPGIAHGGFFEPQMAHLAEHFAVFAFDNAGFGDSDPLPIATTIMADLAEALAEALDMLAMPPAVLFGYHSGAAVAVELAARHPRFVSGLVVDGMPIFTAEETDALFTGDFAPPLAIDRLGGHFAQSWTRFRDQTMAYPWYDRRPERMLPRAHAATPDIVDTWVRYFFQSAPSYAGPFRDAHDYGRIAADRIAGLAVPASFLLASNDFLVAHAERLPPGQHLVRIGPDPDEKVAMLDTLFARHAGSIAAPTDQPPPAESRAVLRHYVDLPHGQLLVRSCGRADAPALLLLHDAPGSAAPLEPMMAELGEHFRVIAPDLPGCSGSDPLPGTPSIADIADAMRALALERPAIHGIGFGASVAIACAGMASRLVLQGVLLPDDDERAGMRAHYAPPIAIEPDGAHWFRTWQMLRDMQIYFPWYDRRREAQRLIDADFSGPWLHDRTVAVMRQRAGYAQLIHAALDHDAAAALAELDIPIERIADPATPFSRYDAKLAALS